MLRSLYLKPWHIFARTATGARDIPQQSVKRWALGSRLSESGRSAPPRLEVEINGGQEPQAECLEPRAESRKPKVYFPHTFQQVPNVTDLQLPGVIDSR